MDHLKIPAVIVACLLMSGCDDFDSLYGGSTSSSPQFSDPTDYSNDNDDSPGNSTNPPLETDPDPPTDPGITPTLQ